MKFVVLLFTRKQNSLKAGMNLSNKLNVNRGSFSSRKNSLREPDKT